MARRVPDLIASWGPIFVFFSYVFLCFFALGASCRQDGCVWRVLVPRGAFFGVSWRVLALRWGSSGASWSQDGTLVARLGAKLPQNGAKLGQLSAKECQEGPR